MQGTSDLVFVQRGLRYKGIKRKGAHGRKRRNDLPLDGVERVGQFVPLLPSGIEVIPALDHEFLGVAHQGISLLSVTLKEGLD